MTASQPRRRGAGVDDANQIQKQTNLSGDDDDDDDGSGNDKWDPQYQHAASTIVQIHRIARDDGGPRTGTTILSDLWDDGVITPPTLDSSPERDHVRPAL
jgi:hypothetical protein